MKKKKEKKYKSIFLLDCSEQELLQNKRLLEMLDLAEEVHLFDSANEALLHLVQPGQVPDILITGPSMQDTDIKNFMRAYENLPAWVTGHCKVCLLLEPVEMEEENNFHHPLLHKTMHRPLCVHELMDEGGEYMQVLAA